MSEDDSIYAKAVLDNAKEGIMKNEINTDNLEIYSLESIKKDDPHEYNAL
ncbi:Putative periplasmic protein [Campylobacter coli 76339]|nr:Putative periplasmic protein [Campylobacter coli 76339]